MKMELQGHLKIKKRTRSGIKLPSEVYMNTIQSSGKTLFLDVGTGASSSHMDAANATIVVENSTPSTVFSQVGVDTGPTHDNGSGSTDPKVTWEWEDNGTTTYTVNTVEIRQGSTSGTLFSTISPSFGGDEGNTKPESQIWTYVYTLTFGSSDTNFYDDSSNIPEGIDTWLQVFTDTTGNHWSQGSMEIDIFEASDLSTVAATVQCSNLTTPATHERKYEFEATESVANVDWEEIRVQGSPWTNDTGYGDPVHMYRVAESIGTKNSNTVRRYFWTLSV